MRTTGGLELGQKQKGNQVPQLGGDEQPVVRFYFTVRALSYEVHWIDVCCLLCGTCVLKIIF